MANSVTPAATVRPANPRIGPIEFDVSTWVYATVTLMSLLVVYDGWGDLKGVIGIVIVVVGPTLALAMAHTFAEVLEHGVITGRQLHAGEKSSLLLDFLTYLLVSVPPLIVLAVMSLVFNASLTRSIQVMLYLGVASLGFWGALAGHRAGRTGWRLVLSGVAGLAIGLIVLAVQIALKPH